MELNHTFRRQFLKALDQAFTNKDEIENLVWLTFNKSLDQIAINKETSSAIIWTVIHVAEKEKRVPQLLAEAIKLRENDEALRQLSQQLRFVLDETEDKDHYEALFLKGDRVLVNRKYLRDALRDFMRTSGKPILLVQGPSGSGKTHTRYFISYLAETLKSFRVILIDFADMMTYANGKIEAEMVGNALAARMCFDGMPKRFEEQEARWVGQYYNWLLPHLRSELTTYWFVFDHFEKALLSPGVLDLIRELAFLIDTDQLDARLVLLGYQELLPISVDGSICRETLRAIGKDDVVDYFIRLYADRKQHKGIAYSVRDVASSINVVWRKRSSLQSQKENAQALKILGEAIVQEIKKLYANPDEPHVDQKMCNAVYEELSILEATVSPQEEQHTAQVQYGPYHRAAAVLSTFDSNTLKPTKQVKKQKGLQDLLADSVPVHTMGESNRWTLRPEVRREVLQQMRTRRVFRQALQVNNERSDDDLQQMIEAYIEDKALPIEEQTIRQLAATIQISEWFHSILENVPSLEKLQQRRDFLLLLEPFRELADVHFRGREAQLETLREYVGVLSSSKPAQTTSFSFSLKPIFIYGLGGIGKSTLVARFLWEHATLPDRERFPWIYIDFDRPGLFIEEPLTWLVEGIHQLGIQYPLSREQCESVREKIEKDILTQTRALRTRISGGISQHALPVYSGIREWKHALTNFASLLKKIKVAQDPLLLVLDTFEEVQYRSELAVQGVFDFLRVLHQSVPQLRVVLIGRAFATEAPYKLQEMHLVDFDEAAAQGFLESQGIPSIDAVSIVRQVGGNPLSLRLAVEIWRAEDKQSHKKTTFDLQLYHTRLQVSEVQGILFRRLLDHIHDEKVRKLALHGLVLRRITPGLIREVLAGPCGVEISEKGAEQILFAEMQREVGLFTYEAGALRQRSDVRRVVVRLLRASGADKVRRIGEAAIAYYEHFDDPESRAEELYHRLMLQQSPEVLTKRWIDNIGLERYLYSALEDIHLQEKIWLAPRLSISLTAQELLQADIEGWERNTLQRVQEYLLHNRPSDALIMLREREERTLGSQLFEVEAQVLEQLSRWEEAREVLKKGLQTATRFQCEYYFHYIQLSIRVGDLQEARTSLNAVATFLHSHEDATLLVLERDLILLGLYAAEGKSLHDSAVAEQRVVLHTQFDLLSDEQVQAHPKLMGWFASEVGDLYPESVLRILLLNGLNVQQRSLLRLLIHAFVDWDFEISRAHRELPGFLARQIHMPEAKTLQEAWAWAVQEKSPDELAQYIVKLHEQYTLPAPVLAVVIDILREYARDAIVYFLTEQRQNPALREEQPSDEETLSGEIFSSSPEETLHVQYTKEHDLKLTREQLFQFYQALLDAFSDRTLLSEMLHARLGRHLDAITLNSNLYSTVADLINTAEAEGWLADLLVAVRQSQPLNPSLLRFAAQFGLAPSLPTQYVSQFRREGETFFDLPEWLPRLGRIESQICRLEIARNVRGTGFLIGPDVLLTSYVVVEEIIEKKAPPQELTIRFDYKWLGYSGEINTGTTYHLASDWLLDYSPYDGSMTQESIQTQPLNYALLRIQGSPGKDPIGGERAELSANLRGWIDVPRHPVPIIPQSPLLILQYVEDQPLNFSRGTTGIIGIDPSGTRLASHVDTGPGSAGAPCFNEKWELLALHHSVIFLKDGKRVNEGTLISAIVNQLQKKGSLKLLGLQDDRLNSKETSESMRVPVSSREKAYEEAYSAPSLQEKDEINVGNSLKYTNSSHITFIGALAKSYGIDDYKLAKDEDKIRIYKSALKEMEICLSKDIDSITSETLNAIQKDIYEIRTYFSELSYNVAGQKNLIKEIINYLDIARINVLSARETPRNKRLFEYLIKASYALREIEIFIESVIET
ncbi:effector-associated domain EAD1-containing protein [Ktedonobacter racemifer]|uniref:Effector-associated domain-containing protein n=1 Tax=Ktedonobacter racemifer DSM 44963 TaxID=485913 RepID=D6TH09_KTERA|nr:effector-associated domain EAD1-containing protein [Ktedonobacter racemifer]EFH88938.1 hypothetical protein Krac_10454 [Ktedonobacter racemifer DSM 44963]